MIWVDVCTLVEYESYLSLNSLTDITHSVITRTVNTLLSFDYSFNDCYGTCGAVQATLNFPNDAPSGLSNVVTVDSIAKTITVS